MKKLFYLFLICMVLFSCDNNENNLKNTKPKLSFIVDFNDITTKSSEDTSCMSLDELRVAAGMDLLTASFTLNNESYSKKVYYKDSKFLVEAIELNIGESTNNVLTRFEIHNNNSKVYEAVQSDSEFKGFVNNTLPVSIASEDVDKHQLKEFTISVMCSTVITPANFGWGEINLQLFHLYTLNYLVFPFDNTTDCLRHTLGNLTIQRRIKNGDNWEDEEGKYVSLRYNTLGTLPVLSFFDNLNMDDSSEGYSFRFSSTEQDYSYDASIEFNVNELKTIFSELYTTTYKYLKVVITNDENNYNISFNSTDL